MELVDLTEAVRGVDFRVSPRRSTRAARVFGIVAPGCGGCSRRELDELTDLAQRHGAGGLVHSVEADGSLHGPPPSSCGESTGEIRAALGAAAGDLILIVADADASGAPRRWATSAWRWGSGWSCGPRASLRMSGSALPDVQVGRRRQALGRHPQPVQRPGLGGGGRLESDPGAVHAQQYDLALNGWEPGADRSASTAATCWSAPSP